METLNRTFNNATTALWNEFQPGEQQKQQLQPHGDEPLSGIQGKGTATDPYDGGNRDDQPGAPRTNANTAVIPEPLVSVTGTSAHDHAKNPKSPSNADVALKSVIVDEPLQQQQQQPPKKMETPDPLTAAAPTAAAEAAGAPSSGSHGAKQLAASGAGVGLPAGKTQMSSTGGVSEQRGSLPATTSKGQVPSYVGVSGAGAGPAAAAGAGETLAIREKEKEKEKDEILHENRGLPAPAGMGPEQKSPSTGAVADAIPITAGGSTGTGTGALQTRDTPATIPDSSISADDKAYSSSKAKPSTSTATSTSQPQQQQQQQQQQLKPTTTTTTPATQPTSAAGAADAADAAASDTESVGPTNETKEARDSTTSPTAQKHHETETETATATATDTLPRGNTKVSEEALKGPQTPAPREPFEFEKRLGSKGGPAKSDAGAGTGAADEAEKHGKGHGQGKMAHLKEKVGKVLHHGK